MLAERTDRQSERDRVEHELFLRAMIGRKLPAARELARQLRAFSLEPGAFLYRAGEVADEVYFVVSGSIGLSRPGGPEREFGPGSMLGIFDVEHERPRARSARALGKVELLALSAEDRLELLEDSFEHTRAVIARMASRLDELGRYDGQSSLDPARTLAPRDEPLPLIERVFTLRDTPAFRQATIQALVRLAPSADELRLGPGPHPRRGPVRRDGGPLRAGALDHALPGDEARGGAGSRRGGAGGESALIGRVVDLPRNAELGSTGPP